MEQVFNCDQYLRGIEINTKYTTPALLNMLDHSAIVVANDIYHADSDNPSTEPNIEIPDDVTVPQFMLQYNHPAQLKHLPRTPWVIDAVSGRAVSCQELQDRSWALANALSLRYNIEHIDDAVVCIVSGNHVDYPTSLWAAHRLGASVFTTNPAFTTGELHLQFREAKPCLFFVQPDALSTVREAVLASGISPDGIILFNPPDGITSERRDDNLTTIQDLVDLGLESKSVHQFSEQQLQPQEGKTKIALFFPSSGTTGFPKLIAVSHYAFIANIIQAAAYDAGIGSDYIPVAQRRYKPGDVSCAVLPFFHILGLLINLHLALFSGMTVIVVPKFSFRDFMKIIKTHSVTHLLLVPPMVVLITKNLDVNAVDLQSVKVVSVAGAPLDNELVKCLAQIIPQAVVGQIYGMTEAGAITAPSLSSHVASLSDPLSGIRSASVGNMLPGISWKVICSDGSLAAHGEKGELWVQTPSMAMGYRDNSDAASDTFVDGWLRTGDEVCFDQQGEIYVVQRLKDFMKVKGYRVNPAELEGHLLEHPDVLDCCVIPIPDEFSGEIPKAFIVPSKEVQDHLDNLDLEVVDKLKTTLIQHVADHKVGYKHLAGGVEFCNYIPKTSSGKLLRRVLRDRVKG